MTNQTATPKQPVALVQQPTKPAKASLIETMAAQYSMEPAAFAAAVKKTAMPANATNEEFAAYMMIAHEYGLNPFLRELFAFPKKGGGIVLMVSIDGWVNLVNKQPNLAGFEFEHHFDDQKKLAAVTCRMYRKDRTMPVVVTEYMSECFRRTEPWINMPSRMLRHKALIQTARYCFGLSGIVDEDEANDISGRNDVSGVKDITPPRPQAKDFVIPANSAPPAEDINQDEEKVDAETGEVTEAESPAQDAYGNAEAYNEGAAAFGAGIARDNVPKNVAQLGFTEAWQAGWDSAKEDYDEKLAAVPAGAKTKDGKLV